MYTELLYGLYLSISVAMTVWVARALFKSGRPFLVRSFHGNEELADSVNRLLVVGFYLMNIGFVLLWLRVGNKPYDASGLIETLAAQIGVVLLVLGTMHFVNLAVFTRLGRKPESGELGPELIS